MSALHDMYVDNPGFDGGGNGNDQGKAQKISPTKRKGSSKKKDEKSNNAAKKREINKWKKYFDNWRSKQPVSMSPDEDFMELARKMIDVDEHIDQHTKLRQHYVLDNGFQINTFEEMKLWWTTVKSFGKVPRARGDYEKNDCPVCKCGPERKLVDLSDHNCPYLIATIVSIIVDGKRHAYSLRNVNVIKIMHSLKCRQLYKMKVYKH